MLVVVCRNVMPERPQILVFSELHKKPLIVQLPDQIPDWSEVVVAENGRLFIHQFAGSKDPTPEGTWLWNYVNQDSAQFFKDQVFNSLNKSETIPDYSRDRASELIQLQSEARGQFQLFHHPEYYESDSPYFESIKQVINQNQALIDVNARSIGYLETETGFILGWQTEDGLICFAIQPNAQKDKEMLLHSFDGEKKLSSSFWFVVTNLGICFASGSQNLIFAHRKF